MESVQVSAAPTSARLRRLIAGLALAGFCAGTAQAAVETYTPGDQNDPRVRAARFLGEDKRHFSALTELLKVQNDTQAPGAAQFPWLLADNYLSFGLRERADAIYQGMGSATVDPLQFDRAQLKLAQFEYTRGYLPEARATLLKLRENLPKELLIDWQDLTARVLMAMGKDAEAIDVLTAPKNGSDQTDYTRYNLGIALLRDGRTEQGRTVLEKVGKLSPTDRDSLALMDRANLTLGWNFLQSQQGAAAKPLLRKVRVEGPYSNRALLGLGWSELTVDGGRARREQINDGSDKTDAFSSFSTLGVLLRRGLVDDPAPTRSFRRISGSSDKEEALKAALPAWLILIDRDPQDPAVQEAWLALPYSLDQIGAHEQARTFYEQAVERLEVARKRTDLAVEALKTNRMVETIVKRDLDAESGWNWELKDLPDAPETYYLQTLLAEHRFAEALKNYRDVRLLARQLDSWDRRLSDMEKAYNTANRASVDTRVLFGRATEGRVVVRNEVTIPLTLDMRMAEPGRYRAPLPAAAPLRPQLRLADLPKSNTFFGTFESIGDLRKRLASLRPNLAKAGDQQGRYLQQLGTKELKAQKDQIEKYLVEARFALARLYDRQPMANDPDEYEIKK
jgi:tetratricopeptide (TPR) repeat protein